MQNITYNQVVFKSVEKYPPKIGNAYLVLTKYRQDFDLFGKLAYAFYVEDVILDKRYWVDVLANIISTPIAYADIDFLHRITESQLQNLCRLGEMVIPLPKI